jgi:hypothetical protein
MGNGHALRQLLRGFYGASHIIGNAIGVEEEPDMVKLAQVDL